MRGKSTSAVVVDSTFCKGVTGKGPVQSLVESCFVQHVIMRDIARRFSPGAGRSVWKLGARDMERSEAWHCFDIVAAKSGPWISCSTVSVFERARERDRRRWRRRSKTSADGSWRKEIG